MTGEIQRYDITYVLVHTPDIPRIIATWKPTSGPSYCEGCGVPVRPGTRICMQCGAETWVKP